MVFRRFLVVFRRFLVIFLGFLLVFLVEHRFFIVCVGFRVGHRVFMVVFQGFHWFS